METNKPKQLTQQDEFEFWCNLIRILIIVLYTPTMILMANAGLQEGRQFLYSFGDWPASRYFFFFAPLVMSLIDIYLIRVEKKSGVPMQKASRNFIYASWVVSLALYSVFVVALFS